MSVTTLYKKITHSAEETEECGRETARLLLSDPSLPPFIALYGDLGVGKTAFTRGVSSVIAPGAPVRSPTFALVNEYRAAKGLPFTAVFHFDMYRIESEDDLDSIGFWDYPARRGLILTEWSEKIPFALPDDYLRLTIEKTADGESIRVITAERIQS